MIGGSNMAEFKDGVKWYTYGTAVIQIAFPEGQVCCRWCPFCREESGLQRYWCRLTNKMIYNPGAGLADGCPIVDLKKEEMR